MPDVAQGDELITVKMDATAARRLASALLDAAADSGNEESRDWLLWNVGILAAAFNVDSAGPR